MSGRVKFALTQRYTKACKKDDIDMEQQCVAAETLTKAMRSHAMRCDVGKSQNLEDIVELTKY